MQFLVFDFAVQVYGSCEQQYLEEHHAAQAEIKHKKPHIPYNLYTQCGFLNLISQYKCTGARRSSTSKNIRRSFSCAATPGSAIRDLSTAHPVASA
eukprot:25133-Rhodomonas_salina.2